MKKHFFTTAIMVSFLALTIFAQPIGNINLLGQYDDNTLPTQSGVQYNDVWGYANDSGEFAVVGNAEYILFLDVTDPSNIVELLAFDAGQPEIWRDFKTYQGYVYGVCDSCSEGLHIFSTDGATVTHELTTTAFFGRAHNIYIDEENARLYAAGVVGATDLIVLDISTPDNPVLIENIDFGSAGDGFYVHDIYVNDHIAYCSHGWDGFYVWDLTDPSSPIELGNVETVNYNHSSWISEDGSHSYFAEEVPTGTPMSVVDLANLGSGTGDLTVVHTFADGLEDTGTPTPHNPYVVGDLLVISYYEDGLKIYDISSPELPVLVGQYDTYDDNNGSGYTGYEGNWGTYPFLPSGNILATDITYGLHVLEYAPPADCETFDSNDGESGFGIWNDGGADAALSGNATYANSGTHSFLIKDNTSTSEIRTDVIDFSADAELIVSFNYISIGFSKASEEFVLELSTDGGATFSEVEEWNYNDEFTNNQREFESLTVYGPFSSTAVLRFRCNATGNSDKVFIDDILIESCSVSTSSCSDGIQNGDEEDVDCGGSCAPCFGCFVQTETDVENGWDGWIDGGADAARSNNVDIANSGTYAFLIKDNTNTSHITSETLDLVGFDYIYLTFNYITQGFNNPNQDWWLQVSTDGGTTFTTFEEFNYTDEFTNGVRDFQDIFYNGPLSSNTQFRFRCDATGNNDKVFIDDIVIRGCYLSGAVDDQPIESANSESASDIRSQKLTVDDVVLVYPNPSTSSNDLNVTLSESAKAFSITDLSGRILYQETTVNANRDYAIPGNLFTKGTYLIQVVTPTGIVSKRFIIIN